MSLIAASRSESTKLFTTSIWWVLAIALVGYIGFNAAALAFVFSAASTGSLGGEGAPAVPPEGIPALLYSTATAVGYVFPLLIGTLMVTSEFRHKTLTSTFLATPRRGLVLGAKLVVGLVVGLLFGVLGVIAAVGPSAAFLAGYGLDTDLTSGDTWALLGRMLIAFVLWVWIGIGVGALIRNQVGAIVGVLVFTLFLKPIARLAASFVEGLGDVLGFLPGAASDALVGESIPTAATGAGGSEPLAWWAGGLVLVAYAAVLVVLGHVVSWRRDVT